MHHLEPRMCDESSMRHDMRQMISKIKDSSRFVYIAAANLITLFFFCNLFQNMDKYLYKFHILLRPLETIK